MGSAFAVEKISVCSASPHPPTSPSSPLSFAQQRLWFLDQLSPGNPFYNISAAIRLRGNLNIGALERSFQEIIRRHAALRTRFTLLEGQPVQVVEPNANFELSVVQLPPDSDDRAYRQLVTTEVQRPFNLKCDRLLRVTLLQVETTEAILAIALHHIVADGWSLGVLVRELGIFYTALVEGRSPILPPLPIQYPDFANWQRQWLQGEVLEKQLAYWRKQLHNLPQFEFESDSRRNCPHPTTPTYRGATYPLSLSPKLTQALTHLSQQAGVSLFMTLLAAFQTLLYRYSGQEDIAVGTPIANRHRSELEGLIGFFVNSLVMRSDLSGNPSFRELLARVRDVTLKAYEHQDLPFEKLVEELDPERDPSRNPLFQIAFALQNAPMQPLQLPGLTLEPVPLESGTTRFDLEVHLWEPSHGLRSLWQSQEGLSGFISYRTDLFDRDSRRNPFGNRIARLVGHFQTLLEGIVANCDTRLSDLPLLTPAEDRQIHQWRQTATLELDNRCFHHQFEAQVKLAPQAIAIVTPQEKLTYQQLNQRANHLARILHQKGVQLGTLVGLYVERSADMLIGILAILKAGGAYVPLDPNYPNERLQFMLADTQVSLILTQSWLTGRWKDDTALSSHSTLREGERGGGCEIVCLDRVDFESLEELEVDIAVTPDCLAYVIYTSGSTGMPKGVLLSHQGLCNTVEAQKRLFHPCSHSRILQFSSLSFDASVFEIALALGCGGTLYVPPQAAQLPGMALIEFLAENAITHALLTPAVLAVLPAATLPSLQVLITGGEVCSSQVVDRWATNRRFFNAYGPTEATIWATVAQLHPGDRPLTIGSPILNVEVRLLDASLNPVPVGIPGEIYIGGVGVARGYLNRPELTAERFIQIEDTVFYQTGDRAQFRSDGTIEFLGRGDRQIKMRGFRVELGEIEATLQRHPAIQDAVVIKSDETRLFAYFSLNNTHLQKNVIQALETQHIQRWQTLYNETYQLPTSPSPHPLFNIAGWNSSYTGVPIPLEEMQEWASDRVQQILALKPKRVLEIGCGTGLLLFQIAPHCQTYVATDFSMVSLETIQTQLTNLPQVQLLHRMATDLEGIDLNSFDVVILNSIVQYFPSEAYLLQVLAAALQAVATDGVMFIGDVRSLPLLSAFHAWVQFSQAEAGTQWHILQQQVQQAQFEEPELAIAPAFFQTLPDRFPQVQQVQIRLSRGRSCNEMTQFRYNVLLYLKSKPLLSASPHDWQHSPISVQSVHQYLIAAQPKVYIITKIKNRRVVEAIATANWLQNRESPKTVGRMREKLPAILAESLDPQDWWDLETQLPYTVELTWSSQTETGDYDAIFIREDVNGFARLPLDSSAAPYTNNPLQSNFARQLIPQLRQDLRQSLPEYMIPSVFVPLEALPLAASGKVDRSRVAQQSRRILNPSPPPNLPLTLMAATLIEIWEDLLQIQPIGVQDNFFELGGHSLLATQMTSRIRDALGLELPLKQVFESPTIAQLAPILEVLQSGVPASNAPPLVRLERSAYRRQRPSPAPSPLPTLAAQELPSPLVPLTLGGSQPPFFCVHPMFGVVFPYLELAYHLEKSDPYGNRYSLQHGGANANRSFYGLQALGLDGKSKPLNRIEAIASCYIQAIQTVQPNGPYYLGGWSFGGLVAFEMAQQLTQAGQEIALLAILDTPAPTHHPTRSQSLKFLLGTALWSTLPFLRDYAALVTQRLPWLSRWQWSAIMRSIPQESRLQLMDESAVRSLLPIVYANAQAAYQYQPQPYSDSRKDRYASRLTLFKAIEQSEAIGRDPTLGWGAFAPHIQVIPVPGNHLSLLKPPHVQTLAQQLGQCFNQSRANHPNSAVEYKPIVFPGAAVPSEFY
ncbi:MAG: amino acid adenylation domain-containing protein [Desertifilum sp. SIO1I2]|nr:amino acid adenylation domain-containing protein [Desertifilum sp. SIO1I2]